jgi:hypothetical protein
MHRALLLSDIVTQIFAHFVVDAQDTEVDAYTLIALSIVNRAFSEHALDLLWARVDAWPLISLVSSEIWTIEQRVSPSRISYSVLCINFSDSRWQAASP